MIFAATRHHMILLVCQYNCSATRLAYAAESEFGSQLLLWLLRSSRQLSLLLWRRTALCTLRALCSLLRQVLQLVPLQLAGAGAGQRAGSRLHCGAAVAALHRCASEWAAVRWLDWPGCGQKVHAMCVHHAHSTIMYVSTVRLSYDTQAAAPPRSAWLRLS